MKKINAIGLLTGLCFFVTVSVKAQSDLPAIHRSKGELRSMYNSVNAQRAAGKKVWVLDGGRLYTLAEVDLTARIKAAGNNMHIVSRDSIDAAIRPFVDKLIVIGRKK